MRTPVAPNGSASPCESTDDYETFLAWRQERLWQEIKRVTGLAEAADLEAEETDAGELQVIGGCVFPKPSSQPPSTVYWNALAVWGILRPRLDGRTISRAQAHRLLKSVGAATDDDGQPLLSFDPPFVPLPERPDNWHSGHITLRLATAEAAFLRERLAQLR